MRIFLLIIILGLSVLGFCFKGTIQKTYWQWTSDMNRKKYRDELIVEHVKQSHKWEKDVTLLIGDSHVERMSGNPFSPHLKLLGLGGDSWQEIPYRINRYPFFKDAPCVIYALGVNDILMLRNDNAKTMEHLKEVLSLSPTGQKIFISLPFKTLTYLEENKKIKDLNQKIISFCEEGGRCQILSSYLAMEKAGQSDYQKDGIHLSKEGYALWIKAQERELKQVKNVCPL